MSNKLRLRILILLGILVVLALLWKNRNSTGGAGLNDFKVDRKTTEKITKILISPNNKSQSYLILEQHADKTWWVKNPTTEVETDTQYVNRILYWMLPRLQVKSPVGDKALENVTRNIALHGKKIILYQGNKEVRTFFVGGGTPDGYATYMHLPGADRPSIIEIPGFAGTLDYYFTNNILEWRSAKLFSYKMSDISKLEVLWAQNPADNFTITHNQQGPKIQALGINPEQVSSNTILTYLHMFESVYRESGGTAGINNDEAAKKKVLEAGSFFELKIYDSRGKLKHVKLYHRPLSDESYSISERVGTLKEYETDSYFAQIDNGKELFVVQDIVFKKLMKTASNFVIH